MRVTSVRLTVERSEKLRTLADMLGTTATGVLHMLIDNAKIVPVEKIEASVTLYVEREVSNGQLE